MSNVDGDKLIHTEKGETVVEAENCLYKTDNVKVGGVPSADLHTTANASGSGSIPLRRWTSYCMEFVLFKICISDQSW
ncbi:hypothetical protein Tco_1282526 [Tanacetum coccineum]